MASRKWEVERLTRSILKRLRIAQAEKCDWKADLQFYLVMYRTTPHITTGISPSELLFKCKIRTKLQALEEFSFDDMKFEIKIVKERKKPTLRRQNT